MLKQLFLPLLLFLTLLVTGAEGENRLLARPGYSPKIHTAGDANYRADENGLHLQLSGHLAVVGIRFPLTEGTTDLLLSGESSCRDVKEGAESWRQGQVSLIFFDKEGRRMKTRSGNRPHRLSGTQTWRAFQLGFTVPEGAVSAELDGSNYGESGRVEFRNLKLSEHRGKLRMDAPVPDGSTQEQIWSLDDAFREKNALRETICLNGLWQFLPVREADSRQIPPPGSGWGYFKVPGVIPDNSWLSGSAQSIWYHPQQTDRIPEAEINRAWYRRTLIPPREWSGKRLILAFTGLQSRADVFVDGRKAGRSFYPGTPVDLTGFLKPGKRSELAVLVAAVRSKESSKIYMAGDRTVKAFEMRNRGITGDLFLSAIPDAGVFSDVRIETSVRKWRIAFDCGLERIRPGRYRIRAEIREKEKPIRVFDSPFFELRNGQSRYRFDSPWRDPKLWDTDHPENLYTATLTLFSAESDTPLDQFGPEQFGFREFRIEGRQFLLNEIPIHLRMLVAQLPTYSPDVTNDAHCDAICRKLSELNVNTLISGAYNCDPGTIGYQDSFYRSAARHGILTSLTLPHVKNYPDLLTNPATAARYRAEAEWFLRRHQNNPSIVLYAMNHNFTGYYGNQNPQKIDGIHSQDAFGKSEPRQRASAAWRIVHALDPSRPIYHHESGNLDGIYTINCYLNWAPIQEKSDWFEHWESRGRIPLMLLEWGAPHVASYSSHRGNPFIHHAAVNQWLHLLEWGAPFFGEEVYASTPALKRYYREESRLLRDNAKLHLWQLQSAWEATDLPQKIWEKQLHDNLFALRRRGVSAILPWDQTRLMVRKREFQAKENPDRFRDLKRPGVSPDRFNTRQMRTNWMLAYDLSSFEPTPFGRALAAGFAEITGRITGPGREFSQKDHNYRAGETVRKQLTILNDSRRPRPVSWSWRIPELGRENAGTVTLAPGTFAEIPLEFRIPADCTRPSLTIQANFRCAGFPDCADRFSIDVIPRTPPGVPQSGIGVLDPEGSAKALLRRLSVPFREIREGKDCSGLRLLICGRNSLQKPIPGLEKAIRSGTVLLILEQPYETLYRLGFRAQIHGLRQVWTLAGPFRAGREVRDWRGKSTLLPEALPDLPEIESSDVRQPWGHLSNTRVWRAGNRGMVAGVLPEKPTRGDFLPLMIGGFHLEYAPLLEYSGRDGRAIFCQLDLSGRTVSDPEAEELFLSCIRHALNGKKKQFRPLYAAGSEQLRKLLEDLSFPARILTEKTSLPDDALIVFDRSGAETVRACAPPDGAMLLALDLTAGQIAAFAPGAFQLKNGIHGFERGNGLRDNPVFAGISQADLHFRTEKEFAAFEKDGPGGQLLRVLPRGSGKLVFYQLPPWKFQAEQNNERNARKHSQYCVARLLANLGAASSVEMAPYLAGEKAHSSGNFPLPSDWRGEADPGNRGIAEGWNRSSYDTGKWKRIKVPGYFNSQRKPLATYLGSFWYQLRFDLPLRKDCELRIGPVDDESFIWLNDRFLGEISRKTNPRDYWKAPRVYPLKRSDLKAEGNVLTILCRNISGSGGIPERPFLKLGKPTRLLYADDPLPFDDPYRYYRW